jgi:hypothetical protein
LPPLSTLLLELGALGLMGLGAGWLWLRPLHRPAPPRWLAQALLALALLLLWVLSALPAAHTAHPASLEGTGSDVIRRALPCFIYGSLLGLPPALLTALLGRGARRLVRLTVLPVAAGAPDRAPGGGRRAGRPAQPAPALSAHLARAPAGRAHAHRARGAAGERGDPPADASG